MNLLKKSLIAVARLAGSAAIVATLMIAACAGTAFAQGSRKDDIVFNAQGRPMAGAAVRVCTSSASGQPCSPLASLFSDPAMTQALANPLSADGLGNYTFYAAPGRYEIEISGPGITTKQLPNVILPSDPSSPTFTTVTTTSGISAFSLSLSGNLTVTGSTAVAGTLSVGGAPVPSTGADNQWGGSQRFKGPTPWRDFTAYMQQGGVAIPGGCSATSVAYDPTTTGTIASGSASLLLSAAQDFKNGCDVSVIGAGPTTSLPPPQGSCTISTVTESGNTVTVTCTGNHNMIMVNGGAGQGVVISGVGVSGYNGTFVMTNAPSATTFTYLDPTASLSNSTGGTATENWGYAHGATGSTTYKYQVAAVDSFGGVSAAGPTITIANGNSALTVNNYNWINYGASDSSDTFPPTFPDVLYDRARMYLIYSDGGLGGALSCVGTSFTVGYSDFGLPMPCPPFAPATPPGSAQPQMLNATIASGGGTTTLILGTAASHTATVLNVYHDNTRFLKLCLTDAVTDQQALSGGTVGGSFGCYIPAGSWAFNYQMPTDRVSATSPYTSLNGMHILIAGSPQFATIPWIFTSNDWDIEGAGYSGGQISFSHFPTTAIATGQNLPGLFVLEGGANNMSIEGFSALYLAGHGIWTGADNPYNGGAPAGLRFSKFLFQERFGGYGTSGGAPVLFDGNTIGVWMDHFFLAPSATGLDAIYFTISSYADNASADFYISDFSTQNRGIKIDGPGGLEGGGGYGGIRIRDWVSESLVAASSEPGYIEHDNGPNAPGTSNPGAPIANGLSIDGMNGADAASGPNAYSLFVENGSSVGYASGISVSNVDGSGRLFSCSSGSTACASSAPSFPAMVIDGPVSDATSPGNYGGAVTYDTAHFDVGVPLRLKLPPTRFGTSPFPLFFLNEMPPLLTTQVTGTTTGSLSAGTYCMTVVGLDNQATPGQTLPSPEVCQTVGASGAINLSWVQGGTHALVGVYGGFRLYYTTGAPGSEANYVTAFASSTNANPVTYTFSSTSGNVSAALPTSTTAYSSWINADSQRDSCLLCIGNNSVNAAAFRLGINQSSPLERLDVGGGINTSKYYRANETTAPTCASSQDFLWADSTAHTWKKCENNGTVFSVPGTLAGTTGSIGGSALTAGQCATGTVSVTGSTTTMTVSVSPNTYPGDGMIPWAYVSASGTVTVKVCAQASGTPTSSTYNVRVIQ